MYAELHLHTCFSMLDGASQPLEMVMQAAALGYKALAVTDHDGLYGAYEFAVAASNAGIQPITGAEITLAGGAHVTLLAESRTGYANLSKLITATNAGRPPGPALPDDETPWHTTSLADYAEGLILLTGCRQGELCQLLDHGRIADAQVYLRRMSLGSARRMSSSSCSTTPAPAIAGGFGLWSPLPR